jgi:hypothetical protein
MGGSHSTPFAPRSRRTASAFSASDSGSDIMAATAEAKPVSSLFTAPFTAPTCETCCFSAEIAGVFSPCIAHLSKSNADR